MGDGTQRRTGTATAGDGTTDRQDLLVLVGRENAEHLIRLGARMASAARARWTVAHITARGLRDIAGQERLQRDLQLAEQLGADVVALTGHDLVAEVLAYATENKVTQIVLGRSRRPWRWFTLRPSLAGALMRRSHGVAVTVAEGIEGKAVHWEWRQLSVTGYIAGAAATAVAGGLSWLLAHSLSTPNLSLVFLMAVLVIAVYYGRGAALATAILSFLTFNFLFTAPRFTFRVASREDVFTLVFFLIVALLAGQLGARLRQQMIVIRDNARLNSLLYEFSRRLNAIVGSEDIARSLREYLEEILGICPVVLLDTGGEFAPVDGPSAAADFGPEDRDSAELALENDIPTGGGSDGARQGKWYFVPMRSAAHRLGVIGLDLGGAVRHLSPMHRRIVFALRDQASVALEKQRLAAEVAETQVAAEGDRLRAALLSSVSHDLRTPLVSIIGAASTLLEMRRQLDENASLELLEGLLEEAERLNRFVQNLLDMARLGYGAIKPKLEWHDLREIVGEARRRLRTALSTLTVETRMPEDCLIHTDSTLLEQVLVNLLDNAAKFAPAGSTLRIEAATADRRVSLAVEDEGAGIPPTERGRVFDMFYRVDKGDRQVAGTGLGLAICRDLVAVLGGTIHLVDGAHGRGARVEMEFPQPPTPARVHQ